MRIELLKPWRHCVPPFVMESVADGLAELLVRRKIGRIVEPVAQEAKLEQQRPTRPAETTPIGTNRKGKST